MKFTVAGNLASVMVNVLFRNNEESEDYDDANWVGSAVEVSVPGYRASFEGNVRTDEIKSFLEGLKKMNQNLSGFVEFNSMEGLLNLRGEINKVGQIEWKGNTTYPIGTGAVLKFSFLSDQSFLSRLLSELESVMKEFPVKGKRRLK